MEGTVYKKINKYYYDSKSPVGRGAFSTIYTAFDMTKDDEQVALKTVAVKTLLEDKDQLVLFEREIDILRKIRGKHVVQLLDVMQSEKNLYIFMEYCGGGDLKEKIEERDRLEEPFTEEEACSIVKQIANVFVTLNAMDLRDEKGKKLTVMHRDIKPENIMFHEGKVKLVDFGFAKMIDNVNKDLKGSFTLLGSPMYMPPQILNNEDYNYKCDVWSAGMVLYELLFNDYPWKYLNERSYHRNILAKSLDFPGDIKEEIKDLLIKMLTVKETERITWEEVYSHPALKDIKI
jgi:serine/threonine protein kinase